MNRDDFRVGDRGAARTAPLTGVVLALGLALASCRGLGASSANLDAIHGDEARHKHAAPLTTNFKYAVGNLFGTGVFRKDSPLLAVKVVPIDDTATVCLENLVELSSVEPRTPAEEATLVRHYSYLAIDDPWSLTRERALIELGFAGERLGLEGPVTEPELPANAPALSEAMAGLVSSAAPMIVGRASSTEQADFTAACGVLEAMPLDVEGGRRLLKAISSLSDRVGRSTSIEALDHLNRRVQRQMVGLALAHGLRDPNGRARAAAFEANWRAYGEPFLREALDALDVEEAREEPAPTLFDLPKEWYTYPGQEDVYVTVFGIVAEYGLPLDPGLEPRLRMLQQLSFLRTLCQITVSYTAHGDRARTSAMLALAAVSGSGLESLRMEDWQRWWGKFSVAELQRLREEERADSEERL